MGDEAHTSLNDFVNKNVKENILVVLTRHLRQQKLTFRCGLLTKSVISEHANDIAVTFNGECCRKTISDLLQHELDNLGWSNMRSQQNGASCHISDGIVDLLL